MSTNIVIDDELMRAVLKVTGLRTKREAVEAGDQDTPSAQATGRHQEIPWQTGLGRGP